MLDKLRRFAKEDNRFYAPMSSIRLNLKFIIRLERLMRFAKGENRDYPPMSPISL